MVVRVVVKTQDDSELIDALKQAEQSAWCVCVSLFHCVHVHLHHCTLFCLFFHQLLLGLFIIGHTHSFMLSLSRSQIWHLMKWIWYIDKLLTSVQGVVGPLERCRCSSGERMIKGIMVRH